MKDRIEQIYSKVLKLMEVRASLESENELLKQSVELHKKTIQELSNEKENLENKLKFYTLAPESLNKKDIKQKIDQYIEEIDNCIKMLDHT